MGALYGIDLDTTSTSFAALSDDPSILAQWVVLQLATATGIYWSSPYTGADVSAFVNQGMTQVQLAALPGQIEAGLQDQRIASVDVTVAATYLATGEAALKIAVVVTPADGSLSPFSLTAIASAAVATLTTQGI